MNKKILLGIIAILAILLAAVTVLYFNKLGEIKKLESMNSLPAGTGSEKQDTIDALSEEIIQLKAELEAMRSNSSEQVKQDAKAFLELYYNIDSDRHDEDEYLEEISQYLTDNAAGQLMIYEHGGGGFTDDGVEYHSEIQIDQLYYDAKSDTEANIFCRSRLVASFDNNLPTTAPLFVSLDMVYDSDNSRWIVDNVVNYSGV